MTREITGTVYVMIPYAEWDRLRKQTDYEVFPGTVFLNAEIVKTKLDLEDKPMMIGAVELRGQRVFIDAICDSIAELPMPDHSLSKQRYTIDLAAMKQAVLINGQWEFIAPEHKGAYYKELNVLGTYVNGDKKRWVGHSNVDMNWNADFYRSYMGDFK